MESVLSLVLLLACVGAGLVAGLCFTFASFVLRAFDGLGGRDAIRAMQAINTTILRSSAMPVWMGSSVLALVAAGLSWTVAVPASERWFATIGALAYLFGALFVTRTGNIPRNEALDRVDAGTLEPAQAEEVWRDYCAAWQRWNVVRTIACSLATGAFALAL